MLRLPQPPERRHKRRLLYASVYRPNRTPNKRFELACPAKAEAPQLPVELRPQEAPRLPQKLNALQLRPLFRVQLRLRPLFRAQLQLLPLLRAQLQLLPLHKGYQLQAWLRLLVRLRQWLFQLLCQVLRVREMKRPRQGLFRLEHPLLWAVLFPGRLHRNLCPVKYLWLLQLQLLLKAVAHRIRST